LIRIILTRLLLLFLPFAAYFFWQVVVMRSEQAKRITPWAWLVGAGCVLVGLSLMATAVLHPDNRGEGYVPAQAHPGGQVTPGAFDPGKGPKPVGAPEPNTAP
jgi:hypothetical protein